MLMLMDQNRLLGASQLAADVHARVAGAGDGGLADAVLAVHARLVV